MMTWTCPSGECSSSVVVDTAGTTASVTSPSTQARTPFAFVSCAESGWPDVAGGSFVESNVAPEWLRRYLVAKRAVEAKLTENSDKLRPVVYRPSLIWSWGKLDVLPIIPVFNLASALGVPFVDRTIRVGTLADAIVAGIAGDAEGVQRFAAMDELALEARA